MRTEKESLMWMLNDSWQSCSLDENGNYINYENKLIEILINKVLDLEEKLSNMEGIISEIHLTDEQIINKVNSEIVHNFFFLDNFCFEQDHTGDDCVRITFIYDENRSRNKDDIQQFIKFKSDFTKKLFNYGLNVFPYINFTRKETI